MANLHSLVIFIYFSFTSGCLFIFQRRQMVDFLESNLLICLGYWRSLYFLEWLTDFFGTYVHINNWPNNSFKTVPDIICFEKITEQIMPIDSIEICTYRTEICRRPIVNCNIYFIWSTIMMFMHMGNWQGWCARVHSCLRKKDFEFNQIVIAGAQGRMYRIDINR